MKFLTTFSTTFLLILIWRFSKECAGQPSSPEDWPEPDDDDDLHDPVSTLIFNLKEDGMPCKELVEMARMGLVSEDYQVRLNDGLRECEPHYSRLIDTILDDYGFIGRAMRRWMAEVNDYLVEYHENFKNLEEKLLRNNLALHYRLDATLHLLEDTQIGFDPVQLEENKQLQDAFLYGMGICMHVRQTPLQHITMDWDVYWEYHETVVDLYGPDQHKLTYLTELKSKRGPDGRLSVIILLRSLSKLCYNLALYPQANYGTEISRIAGLGAFLDHMRQPVLEVQSFPHGISHFHVISILDTPVGRDCNHSDYFRFETGMGFLRQLQLNELRSEMTIGVMADRFINNCYSRIMIKLDQQRIKLTPDDLSSYVFSLGARESFNSQLTNIQENWDKLSTQLDTREYLETTVGDRLFVDISEKSRIMSPKQGLIAYVDGLSGYCEFYSQYRFVYNQPGSALLQLIELFDFLTNLHGHWTEISSEATGFYFMWRMCRENRLFPLDVMPETRESLGLNPS